MCCIQNQLINSYWKIVMTNKFINNKKAIAICNSFWEKGEGYNLMCNNIESDHLIIIYSDHKIKYKVDHVINMVK
jgi:hypothetical protein